MDFEYTVLIAGLATTSLALAYANWVRVRVIRLRQDLFEIRDDLFDAAAALCAFDDPAYREYRAGINAMIRFASVLSVPMIVFANTSKERTDDFMRSEDAELQEAIDHARSRLESLLATYLIHSTLTGWITTALILAVPGNDRERGARAVVSRVLNPQTVTLMSGAG